MLETIKQLISDAVKSQFGISLEPHVSVPEEQFGDVATNVAMQIVKQVGSNPREIAEKIAIKLRDFEKIVEVSVAGPGFINIRLSDAILLKNALREPAKSLAGQTIICEYSDMNAFKTAHVGHLYTTLVGNAVANLLEVLGAKVVRANFGGDVGLHVGKAMWSVMHAINGDPARLSEIPEQERASWVTARYIEGNTAYETDEISKTEIIKTNKKVYALHANGDQESDFAKAYWTCRQWSYAGFEQFYTSLQLDKQPDGTFFVYYPESLTASFGVELVGKGLEHGVFAKSDGATVYKGEKDGLHTRVFLTREGLPTYETKDLGLAVNKWQDYHYDRNIVITASDITEYMKVVLKALSKLLPETDGKTTHLTHGLVKLTGGQKMSSRKGNVLLPEDVLEAARTATLETVGKVDESAVLGAIKYAFLKNRIGGDIIYDPAESVSIQGNSGPYLQYAHARAKSILHKFEALNPKSETNLKLQNQKLETGERTLVRKLAQYSDVIELATSELAPHHICTYLYELAQEFNRFYEQNKVIGDARQETRITLVEQYANTLKKGLNLLGIDAPEKM